MIERGGGRIVITGSGAVVPPGLTAGAVQREQGGGRPLRRGARESARRRSITVFVISPGLVKTEMTGDGIPDDAPWTPPELAPRLVRALASGELDDSRAATCTPSTTRRTCSSSGSTRILAEDLNAIRIRRET